jgi:hypothetical protein
MTSTTATTTTTATATACPPAPSECCYTTPLVPASSATLTVAARHRCSAPAALVFRTLRNTETWWDWNSFCPRVTIRSQPDDDDEREALEFRGAATARHQGHHHDHVGGAPDKASSDSHANGAEQRKSLLRAEAAAAAAGTGTGDRPATPNKPPPPPAKHSMEDNPKSRSEEFVRYLRKLGGEPSVRLKDGTRMTLHVRMKLPHKLADYRDVALVVTEVSRPNDPVAVVATTDNNPNPDPAAAVAAGGDYAFPRRPTHTDAGASGIYRLSWATDADKSLADGGFPRFLLQVQRVHEVRPIIGGGGGGGCEIVTWECQRGLLAPVVKALYGQYLQDRFDEWVKDLADHCEQFAGKVDRRDFCASAPPRRS